MIKWIMDLALKQRVVVVCAALLLVFAGLYSFHELDIEAYPDPVQPRIEITTQPYGYSAEEVEKLVTIPLETAFGGLRNLQSMRTISLFGVSDIKLYFNWESDYYWDHAETLLRMSSATMPPNVVPTENLDNPIGEVYRFYMQSPNHDLMAEKTAADFTVYRQLKTVPGVEDVSTFGGLTKEYHVDVDPEALSHYKMTLGNLNTSLANANINVGGNYLQVGDQSYDVRGVGFMQTLEDIENTTLTANGVTPVRVKDVADVSVGHAPRLGIVAKDKFDDIVQGVVLMRKYGNTIETLKGVEKKVEYINKILPNGMKVLPYYDRTELVNTTLHTVFENLGTGMVLVFLVLIFFLGNMRAALISAINIPLAMFGAFILLHMTGTPANLLSLGAVDFGIIIDSTIIVVENIFRHLTGDNNANESRFDLIRRASAEVGGPMFYSTLIFLIAFLPLFTMKGVEGVIFSPMSHTYSFALTTAILLAITLTPVLSSFLLPKGLKESNNVIWEAMYHFYHNLNVKILQKPRLTLTVILLVMVAGLAMFPLLGGEFLPKLEEGNIWARATLPLTTSLEHANDVARRARRIFQSYPEVTDVISQLGRPDDATDTSGFFNIEFFVDLKPSSQWPRGLTKEGLTAQMNTRFAKEFPDVNWGYSQNIEDNVEEALSGVKGVNAIKIYGPDLAVDEQVAGEVKEAVSPVRGMADVAVYRSLGQPDLTITPDRKACSRYGINVGDVNSIVQAAIGGMPVTTVYEGEQQINLAVRWQPKYRESLDAIRQIRVAIPSGGYIPLAQVADIGVKEGASFIYREGLQRYVPIRFSTRDRDMQSTIDDAKRAVAEKVKLPPGVSVDWVGEIGELKAANARFKVVIPLALLLIWAVLYAATNSFVNTMILMAQIPLACLGGIVALAITGTPFSISAAVGFISIFAIAIMDGILLNFYIHQLFDEGYSLMDSIVMGADRRMRAVMMTATVDGLGLLPMALSTKVGAQAQRPLAIVVIGGAISIALLTRVFMPTLMLLLHKQIGLVENGQHHPKNGNGDKS
jgi:cobalt-zinc-cadmium resistance protein CzcA